jgi:hypothetical protein
MLILIFHEVDARLQLVHLCAADGIDGNWGETRCIGERTLDAAGEVFSNGCNLFGIEGIVVDTEVINVALEVWVGTELAAGDVVECRTDVTGTNLHLCRAGNLLTVEVEDYGICPDADGHVIPYVGIHLGG